jgi:hypothetical protein
MSEENEDDLLGQPLEWVEVQYEGLSAEELDERLTVACKHVVEADQGVTTAEQHLQEAEKAAAAATLKANLGISKAKRNVVARYIEFGGACDALKKRTPKKKWGEEVKKRFEPPSHETVNLCMKFWRYRELLRDKGALSVRNAQEIIKEARQNADDKIRNVTNSPELKVGAGQSAPTTNKDKAAAGSKSNGAAPPSGPIDGKQLLADVNRAQQVAALLTNEDVVPGLHQAIDKKDKAGIAKPVFNRLKATELVKAEMLGVLQELRLLVDTAWPGEPPPLRRPVGQGAISTTAS